jgi:hypothetical protein
MALPLVFIGVAAIVGFALYCMVCERLAANRLRHVTPPAVRTDTITLPASAPPTLSPVLHGLEA